MIILTIIVLIVYFIRQTAIPLVLNCAKAINCYCIIAFNTNIYFLVLKELSYDFEVY